MRPGVAESPRDALLADRSLQARAFRHRNLGARKPLATAIIAGILLASAGAAEAVPGDDVYARPGEIVSAGDGARLNFICMGHGSPAVIFDSGWEDWAPVWAIVQPQVAKWTRACSYDRAGAGFSEAGPMPRTSVRIASELHTALHNAGVAGPYILVGHAFGGDNVRAFADLFMPEVAGLVLVEADPVELMSQERQDRDHKGHAGLPAELRDCRDAIAGTSRFRCSTAVRAARAPARSSSFAACRRCNGRPRSMRCCWRSRTPRSRCTMPMPPKWKRRCGTRIS